MARIRMVTRTINVVVATAMTVDVTTAQVKTQVFELTGTATESDKVLKALKKEYETDTLKIVSIQNVATREDMYGIKEVDFLKVATKLDPATRKMVEAEQKETLA